MIEKVFESVLPLGKASGIGFYNDLFGTDCYADNLPNKNRTVFTCVCLTGELLKRIGHNRKGEKY